MERRIKLLEWVRGYADGWIAGRERRSEDSEYARGFSEGQTDRVRADLRRLPRGQHR